VTRRGLACQRQRRLVERSVRMSAVATLRWMQQRGELLKDTSGRLGLKPDTLSRWAARWRRDRMELRARGRPAERPAPELRNEILAIMWFRGPHVGLPALQDDFPGVARAELIELQRRYRLAYGRKTSWLMYTLRWMRPGRVWTTDFTKAPTPIDGCYERLLVVRDLGSGRNLLALPAEAESAEVVVGALEALFARHGPPLVLKSDNGGAFISHQVEVLLAAHGVLHLLSPVRTPQYNGGVEAGIGSLRTRIHYESARNDRPGQWTCDDIEAARLQANFTAHLDGPLSLTPEQAWAARQTLIESEREAFRQVYDQYRHEERRTRAQQSRPVMGRAAEASIDRVAIPRALVECGYLLFRRRRISPPIIRRRVAKIS
jgi:transposase InsO family protein